MLVTLWAEISATRVWDMMLPQACTDMLSFFKTISIADRDLIGSILSLP